MRASSPCRRRGAGRGLARHRAGDARSSAICTPSPPIWSRPPCARCRWARPTASSRWRPEAAVRRATEAALAVDDARRGRHGNAAARLVLAAPRDAIHTAVPLMILLAGLLTLVVGCYRRRCMPIGGWAACGRQPDERRWRAAVVGDGRRACRRPGSASPSRPLLAGVALWPWVMLAACRQSARADRHHRHRRPLLPARASRATVRAGAATSRPSRSPPATGALCRRSAWRWRRACRGAGAGDVIHELAWSAARGRRRPGRLGQDRAGRAPVQADARRYDIAVITNDIYTKEDAEFLTRAGALAPERIVGVETGGCPHTAIREDASINLAAVADIVRSFPSSNRVRRIGRRQSRRDVLARAGRYHDLRDRRLGRRQDPAQGRAGHHALRPAGDQQDRPGAVGRRQPRGHGPRCEEDARQPALRVHQPQGEQRRGRDRRLHRTPGRPARR